MGYALLNPVRNSSRPDFQYHKGLLTDFVEAIETQFGLSEKQVITLMRREMKESSFKMWRERVTGRKTKHFQKRDFVAGKFKSDNQKT